MDGTKQVIETLSKTAQELEIKSEISSILNDIVSDIEIAHSLEKKFNHARQVTNLTRRCEVAEEALREYKAVEKSKTKERQEMGEIFLKDLMVLEEKIERAERSGASVDIIDIDSSSGLDAGDDRVMNIQDNATSYSHSEIQPESGNDDHDDAKDTSIRVAKESNEGETIQTKTDVSEQQSNTLIVDDNIDIGPSDDVVGDSKEPLTNTNAEESQSPPSPASISGSVSTPEPPPVSVTAQTPIRKTTKKKKETPMSLQRLNSSTLMAIFEFMDALDIVCMAQTNARLYTKVNSIFGLGGTVVLSPRDWNYDEEEQEEHAAVVLDDDAEQQQQQQQEGEVVQDTMAGALKSTLTLTSSDMDANASSSDIKSLDSTSTVTSEHRATIVSIPSAKPNGNANVNANATNPPNTDTRTEMPTPSNVNVIVNVKKAVEPTTVKLPPKVKEESKTDHQIPATVPKLPPSTATTAATKKRSTPGFQMSPAVAQSLASKLLPAELSAIISMRDQLRNKEEELFKADEDVNNLTAQLEGTINVKEVLTKKVKDMQKTLSNDREVSAKITRQTASDQEVIAFLDERIQELEKAVDNFHRERSKANKSIEKVKGASERQVAVLNDMLTYEREQKVDQEKEWKSTKKVLVKEVKHCRAQIMALEAERDGYREENEKLKEALLSLGAGNGMPRNVNGNGGGVAAEESRSRSFDTIMS